MNLIENEMCYLVVTLLVKFVFGTTVQHVNCTNLIDPDMKWLIDKFDEELDKQLDDMKLFDDVGGISILAMWMNKMKRHMVMGSITQVMKHMGT